MRYLRKAIIPTTAVLALLAVDAGHARPIGQFNSGERFSLPAEQSYDGDLYIFAGDTQISGEVHGDLVVWSAAVRITGNVDGDVIVGAGQIDISGNVSDTIRIFGSTANISGRVDGDVVFMGAMLNIQQSAHITGNVVSCGGVLSNQGTVDGDLTFTGGEANLDGTIGGNAKIEADAVRLGPQSAIQGDLTYTSRKDLDMAEGAIVAGSTTSLEKPKREKKVASGILGVGWWIWKTLAAMLVGVVLIALVGRAVPTLTDTVGGEAVMGTLIGFGAFLFVPVASFVAIVLIIPLPLGVLALTLFGIALYLAKLPVAVWIGTRLLSLTGKSVPSPYLAFPVGLLTLYGAFAIPWIGNVVWIAATWLGLGAMILATRAAVQTRRREAEPQT